jgi:hypothetical protein
LLLKASLDLPKRAEFHLAKRLLRKAEELLARCDYVQASEKAWGAAQIVKAAKKGKELKNRGDLWRFVSETASEDRELRRLRSRANPPELLRAESHPEMYAVEDAKQFVERFKATLTQRRNRLRTTMPQAGDTSKSRGQPSHAKTGPLRQMKGPHLRGPLRLEAPTACNGRPPMRRRIPPKGSVHSPPQSREDPKDSGTCGRASSQSTAAVENAENHHDDSTTHKTLLLPTTTTSPRPPRTTLTTPN